jgi:hypothetical protein
MPDLVYRKIPELSPEEIEATVKRDDPDELLEAVLSAALHSDDRIFAEKLCIRLSSHWHFNVRGNAILGFAHIARIHERLDEDTIKPIIQRGLQDEHEYVIGQSVAAKDDIEDYLGWKF